MRAAEGVARCAVGVRTGSIASGINLADYCAADVHPSVQVQPVLQQDGPHAQLRIILRQARAVMTLLENVKLRGNAAAQECLIEQNAVHHRDRLIIRGAEEERRRSLRRDLGLRFGELIHERRIRLFSQQIVQRPSVGDAGFHADHGVGRAP